MLLARVASSRFILSLLRKQEFLQKVQDFESGYFRSSFDTPEELYERIHIDVARWLVLQVKQKMQTQK